MPSPNICTTPRTDVLSRDSSSLKFQSRPRRLDCGDADSCFIQSPSGCESTAEEGQQLFCGFLREEIAKEHFDAALSEDIGDEVEKDNLIFQVFGADGTSFKTPGMASVGKELRTLADKFSQSKERLVVHERAEQVALESLTKEEFMSLLEELFKGGLSQMRIVVLFFFCSDLAIRALKNKVFQHFHRFVCWAVTFIADRICAWVQQQGGWSIVLSNSIDYVYKCGFVVSAIAVTIAAVIYIRKRL